MSCIYCDTRNKCVLLENDIDRSKIIVDDNDCCLDDPNCPSYASTYGQTGPILTGPGMEDWALSFEAYVYPERLLNYYNQTALILGGVRENYVSTQINSIP